MDINKMTFGQIKEKQKEYEEICKALNKTPIEQSNEENCDYIGKYVIIRTYSAGVHAGILKSKNGKEVILTNTRRLWYWKGAASLSQLSEDGVKSPDKCKFPAETKEIFLSECIEILPCTDKAKDSIKGVSAWEE